MPSEDDVEREEAQSRTRLRVRVAHVVAARPGDSSAPPASHRVRIHWKGNKRAWPVHQITNEHVFFGASSVDVGAVLRNARVVLGKHVLLRGVDLVVEACVENRLTARIRARRAAPSADSRGVRGYARCAELIVRAARATALTLLGVEEGSPPVGCVGAGIDPHEGLVVLDLEEGQTLPAGDIVAGAFEVDGRRLQFTTAIASRSPPAICVPESLDEVSRSAPAPEASFDPCFAVLASNLRGERRRRTLFGLSATALSFEFDPAEELFPPGLCVDDIGLHLDGDDLRVHGRVARLRPVDGMMQCTVALEPDDEARVRLTAWMARTGGRQALARPTDASIVERIDDPARIRGILQAVARSHDASVRLRTNRGLATSVAPPEVDDAGLTWSARLTLPVTVELTLQNSVCTFALEASDGLDGRRFALPRSLLRVRQRWYRRARLEPRGGVWFGGREVSDLSYGGFSFRYNPRAETIEPGDSLDDTCRDRARRTARLVVEVVAVEPLPGGGRLCHARVAPYGFDDETAWYSIVGARLHPDTRAGARWTEHLWKLYERAGYFELSGKAPSDFDSLKRSFEFVADKLDRAPHLGCHAVFPSKGLGVAGALSVLKVYSRSWLGFQMAKVKGNTPEGISGRAVLRDLHLHAYEHVQRHRELGWLIGYLQVKPVWSRLVHYDLPQRFVARGDAYMVRFEAVEIEALEGPRDAGVRRADELETSLVLATLARSRPKAYLDALDLTPAHYGLEENKRGWRAAGLARDRVTLIARHRDLPVAAVILEVGQDGAHLFRLLDLARLIALAPGASEHYPRLLRAAATWFARQGKRSFVLFREEGTEVDFSSFPRAKNMGLADMSILSAALLPELLGRVYEVTAAPAEGAVGLREPALASGGE